MQRIGRASHQVEAVSRGIIFPKYRGDLLASAAITKAMKEGAVEETRVPRNPLDVLAQQLAAMVALGERKVDELFAARAPRRALRRPRPRAQFEGVLDMLSGRYPSDEFAELRPRARVGPPARASSGPARARSGSSSRTPARSPTAGSTASSSPTGRRGGRRGRVGELDEEMVFESRAGEVFVLGASSWRIAEITRDRVLVVPAPGEPGKMPFWKADRGGAAGRAGPRDRPPHPRAARDAPRGRPRSACGASTTSTRWPRRTSSPTSRSSARRPASCPTTARSCSSARATRWGTGGCACSRPGAGASTRRGRSRSRRACGRRARPRSRRSGATTGSSSACPSASGRPEAADLLPEPEEIEDLVVRELGGTSLFAARFREAAARALLLPRRRPGQRTPLWMQRKRAHDLLQVAARYPSFPIVLEAYRECLRTCSTCRGSSSSRSRVRRREIRLVTVDTQAPSPFSASLLFGYVANYLYDGDAPLAERRAQALAVDQAQLRELLGEAELRELLDRARARRAGAARCRASTPPTRRRAPSGSTTCCSASATSRRTRRRPACAPLPRATPRRPRDAWLGALERERRAIRGPRRGRGALGRRRGRRAPARRARRRAAAGASRGLPRAGSPTRCARSSRATRARTARSTPPTSPGATRRARRPSSPPSPSSRRTAASLEGEFRPGGHGREWCGAGRARDAAPPLARRAAQAGRARRADGARAPARSTGRASRARPRHAPRPRRAPRRRRAAAGRGLPRLDPRARRAARAPPRLPARGPRHAVRGGRGGLGRPRPARRARRPPRALPGGRLCRSSAPPRPPSRPRGEVHERHPRAPRPPRGVLLRRAPRRRRGRARAAGASTRCGTSPGRARSRTTRRRRCAPSSRRTRARAARTAPACSAPSARAGRSRPRPSAAGACSPPRDAAPSATERLKALAEQLLTRARRPHARRGRRSRRSPGGFSAVYPVLRALEEAGRIRRGYFVAGLGGLQFADAEMAKKQRSMARSTCGSSSTVSSAGRIADCPCCMASVPLVTDHTWVAGRSIRFYHRSGQGSSSPNGEVP